MASPLSVSVESLATYAGIGDNGQENYSLLKLQVRKGVHVIDPSLTSSWNLSAWYNTTSNAVKWPVTYPLVRHSWIPNRSSYQLETCSIDSELAAKYTPALVEKFRAKNEVLSPSVTLLNVISHT